MAINQELQELNEQYGGEIPFSALKSKKRKTKKDLNLQ